MITAENITYRAGRKTILHSMSFDVTQGKLTVLLGANGAGKSTLLRLLAGEEKPSEGQVFVNKKSITKFTAQQLALRRAVLTQQHAATLPFTCEEIVMMGRYPHQQHSSANNDKQIVQHCLAAMEATDFTNRLFHTLSGGEQQRVQMARVLAQLYNSDNEGENRFKEKMLLLDEPTASLDYRHQQLCMDKAKAMANQGCTVVAVLHDLNLAARYADYILLLKEGKLLAKGESNDVLQSALISEAYETPIDILIHEDYPFRVLIPSNNKQTYLKTVINDIPWNLPQTYL